jgi:spermidine/putrescine-binding protein
MVMRGMTSKAKAAAACTAVLAVTALAGCGTKVNHDSAQPSEDIQTQWVRIETPPAFATIMFTRIGTTGYYMDQGDGNLSELTADPLCPLANVFSPAVQKRYGFKVVVRTNGDANGTS